ncbi:acyl-CoA thioesterase [Pseudarthrobacter sulfonivorans]|uniref:acyl-CoA thioesterase n=1 Tax=Pseudarthrobacter sulfonivorans TaxID=121292 RepID=UPI0021047CB6|nr:thioesterase family protein [Pseudarthrobacter sulfonivorans]
MHKRFEMVVPLRWSDQDLNGHINNARIVTLMEEARVRWLNIDAAADGLDSFRGPKVVASLNVEYKLPVNYEDELTLLLDITRIGNGSFSVRHTGSQRGATAFIGTTVIVPLDPDSNRSRKLTAAETAYLARYAEKTPVAG